MWRGIFKEKLSLGCGQAIQETLPRSKNKKPHGELEVHPAGQEHYCTVPDQPFSSLKVHARASSLK